MCYESLFKSLLEYNGLMLTDAGRMWSHGSRRFFLFASIETKLAASLNGKDATPIRFSIIPDAGKRTVTDMLKEFWIYSGLLLRDFADNVAWRDSGYRIGMTDADWKTLFGAFVSEVRTAESLRSGRSGVVRGKEFRNEISRTWYWNEHYGYPRIPRPTAFSSDEELEFRLGVAGCV